MYHCSITTVPQIYLSQVANYYSKTIIFSILLTLGQAEYVNNFMQCKFDHLYVTTYCLEEEMESVK